MAQTKIVVYIFTLKLLTKIRNVRSACETRLNSDENEIVNVWNHSGLSFCRLFAAGNWFVFNKNYVVCTSRVINSVYDVHCSGTTRLSVLDFRPVTRRRSENRPNPVEILGLPCVWSTSVFVSTVKILRSKTRIEMDKRNFNSVYRTRRFLRFSYRYVVVVFL